MYINIMDEIYNQYKKSLKKSLLHKNKLISLLESDNIILALNSDYSETNLDAMIIPIGGTDEICFQIFESEAILEDYKLINGLNEEFKTHTIDRNIFYMLVQELYLKGVTGLILNCELDGDYRTMYYPILEFIKYEKGPYSIKKLYTPEKQAIIRILNKVKNINQPLSYIYRNDLTAQEVSLYIIKYQIFNNKSNSCIKLFTTVNEADEYCKTHKLMQNGEPMNTTAHNGALFNSIYHAVDKVKNVELYDNGDLYKIPIVDFLELVSGVGFEQINLGGGF